jgi:hypothetical protein
MLLYRLFLDEICIDACSWRLLGKLSSPHTLNFEVEFEFLREPFLKGFHSVSPSRITKENIQKFDQGIWYMHSKRKNCNFDQYCSTNFNIELI